MSMMYTDQHMEDPLLTKRGTVEFITSNTFAGCSSSDDGESLRSDSTNEYVPVLACFPVSRRKRKMLQPKRAPMYGSEVEGVWCNRTDESQCYKRMPVKQHAEVVHTPTLNSVPAPAAQKSVPAPAASTATRPTSSAAAKCSRKSCSPVCGPCGHCGTTTSPQWRHGNNQKPIVCNACGIRYQRTGSFEKTTQSEKKRAASGGAGAVSGGAHGVKRYKSDSQSTSSVDTYPVNNSPEAVSRPASRATTDSRKHTRSSPTDAVLSNAASSCASPDVIPINNTAAGTAAAQAMTQPEGLQVLNMLAASMGSFDAAIAYLMASAGGMAASGVVVPVAGVPGQVSAHVWWGTVFACLCGVIEVVLCTDVLLGLC